MSDNYLITGYWGAPHITPENDRGIHAAIWGKSRRVLPIGEEFRAEYIGNNTIRMYDGKLIDGGAVAGIPAGDYIDLSIANAGQGMTRVDLIVFQYNKDITTHVETGQFTVVRGNEVASGAVAPTLTQEDLLSDDAVMDQMPLWKVRISGTSIGAPECVFERASSMDDKADGEHMHNVEHSDIEGILPVRKGGTGRTSLIAAEYEMHMGMPEETQAISDTSQVVYKSASGNTTKGALVFARASAMWSYIAAKIRTVFGFTSENVLPIENGGTGGTTGRAAEYHIHKDMLEAASAISDNHQIVYKSSAGSTANGAFVYKNAAAFWTYLAGKIRSTFGFTDENVLPVANGGTGAKTARAAEYAICNDMPEASQALSDAHQIVLKAAVGNATRGALIYCKITALWTYIAGKIRSTFGFSPSNVLPVANGGTGSTAASGALTNLDIRRGKTATLTVGANTAKTLAVTFSSACASAPIVVVTPVGGSSNTSTGMFTYEVYNQTTTGFSIRVVTAAGASFNNAFNYIAVVP